MLLITASHSHFRQGSRHGLEQLAWCLVSINRRPGNEENRRAEKHKSRRAEERVEANRGTLLLSQSPLPDTSCTINTIDIINAVDTIHAISGSNTINAINSINTTNSVHTINTIDAINTDDTISAIITIGTINTIDTVNTVTTAVPSPETLRQGKNQLCFSSTTAAVEKERGDSDLLKLEAKRVAPPPAPPCSVSSGVLNGHSYKRTGDGVIVGTGDTILNTSVILYQVLYCNVLYY